MTEHHAKNAAGDGAHLTAEEARSGETSGHLRTILGVSLALIVIVYVAIYVLRVFG